MKHGLKSHPIYTVWECIKARCYNVKYIHYNNYGGRGIAVCDEWKSNFKIFYDWCVANGWQKGLHLDRYPNNDGNYEPGNCRFVTPLINNYNRRNNNYITYREQTKCLAEWCSLLNLNYRTTQARLSVYKWTVERAFQTKTPQILS